MFNGIACAFTRISKLNIIKIAQVSFQLEVRVFTTVIHAKQNAKNVSSKLRTAIFFLHVPGARQKYYNKRLCNCHTQERSYIQSLIV